MKATFTKVEKSFFDRSLLKELTVVQFLNTAQSLEESIEGSIIS